MDLELQAQAMAERALPAGLAEPMRSQKLTQVKAKILERLQSQAAQPPPPAGSPQPQSQYAQAAAASPQAVGAGILPNYVLPIPPKSSFKEEDGANSRPDDQRLKVEGVEMLGDELWFSDPSVRTRLRESVAEAQKDNKIIVGSPEAEINRICPQGGHVLGAGAVLRLGGARIGGYGEPDIAYAYRQLSRALHPDKNPNIPAAHAAFQRLSEAAEELRTALNEQRTALHLLVGAMNGVVQPEELERPQEALFAEACRALTAIVGLCGEGWLPEVAHRRSVVAFTKISHFHSCQPQGLLNAWMEGNTLLEIFAGSALRAAYDCAPKRLRASFLCLLNRAVIAEAKRCNDCVRGTWAQILETYPELQLWRQLKEKIESRLWELPGEAVATSDSGSAASSKRSKWDVAAPESRRSRSRSSSSERRGPDPKKAIMRHPDRSSTLKASKWAVKWRTAISAILPSGMDGGVSPTDAEVKKLTKAIWKDISAWAADNGADRALGLFRADHQTLQTFGWESREGAVPQYVPARGLDPGLPPAEWSFVPVSDLLLSVGDGMVGMTCEGVFAANRRGHERKSLANCYKKG